MDFSQASGDISGGVALVAKKNLEHGVTSFCPTITGAHSPDEQVQIASVATFWTWLEKSLARIAEQ